jgi:hypothetical protein
LPDIDCNGGRIFYIQLVSFYPRVFAAENLVRHWSVLTARQQIQPVNTSAVGFVGLKFQDEVTRLVFIINVENIGNVTGTNLHQGINHENGTIDKFPNYHLMLKKTKSGKYSQIESLSRRGIMK